MVSAVDWGESIDLLFQLQAPLLKAGNTPIGHDTARCAITFDIAVRFLTKFRLKISARRRF
jgi:hypothetical protein